MKQKKQFNPEYIWGIDLGTKECGLALVNKEGKLIESKVITATGLVREKRIGEISLEVINTINLADYMVMVFEEPIMSSGYCLSSPALFELIGVIKNLLWLNSVPFAQIPAKKVKELIAGKGDAGKEIVAKALNDKFGMDFDLENCNYNETDAVAIALSYLELKKVKESK